MSEDKTLKEIALELLEKYRLSETGLILETSGSISEDITRLEYECNYMRRQIEKVPKPRWIPVKERLPENDVDVLCTIHFVGTHWAPLARERLVDISHCRDGEWYTYLDDDALKDAWFDVVAWMPLPDAYEVLNERRK